MASEFTQQQAIEAFKKAPPLVREAFGSEATMQAILDIKTKYKLHVDTAGTLGKQIGYMMLGLMSPAECLGNLIFSGTDAATAREVMEEINQRIFVPLHKKMMAGEQPKDEDDEDDVPAPEPSPVVAAAPAPRPPQVPPMRVMSAPPAPVPQPVRPPTPQAPAAAPVPMPAPAPRPAPPAPVMRPAPQPPVNLPGAPMPAPAASPRPAPPSPPVERAPATQPPAPAPRNDSLHEVLKSYGVDPYRETPE